MCLDTSVFQSNILPLDLFPNSFSPLFHFFFQLSANCGFIPAKETGILTSINDKLQCCCRIESIHSIRPGTATGVIREHVSVGFLPRQFPDGIFRSSIYFKCAYAVGLDSLWQNLSVCGGGGIKRRKRTERQRPGKCVFLLSIIPYTYWKSVSYKA